MNLMMNSGPNELRRAFERSVERSLDRHARELGEDEKRDIWVEREAGDIGDDIERVLKEHGVTGMAHEIDELATKAAEKKVKSAMKMAKDFFGNRVRAGMP